ncbi:MAG: VWA domain-containing protein [Spirochaetaceae bacterium]
MRKIITLLSILLIAINIYSDETGLSDLILLSEDTYIESKDGEDGLHLFVRKKDGIESILLTDSTEDPTNERSVFALKDFDINETVKGEIRLLNGIQLDPSYNFLIDSTVEVNEVFGFAFHIYIPRGVSYGYPWSREGQIDMGEGSWLNIRTFPIKYGDYDQGFQDNPFIIRLHEEVIKPEPTENIFEEIARETNGDYSEEFDGDGAVDKIGEILDRYTGQDVDLALVVDTTISMKDDVEFIRQKLIPLVQKKIESFKSVRIGVILYRDYKEKYLTLKYDFVDDFEKVQMILNSIKVVGGRDIPEAVFEALYAAQTTLEWKNSAKIIVQVGDAPPHPEPRGEITSEMVYQMSRDNKITIFPIMLKDKKRTEVEEEKKKASK